MKPQSKTISLCMIVKNEAHVIRRCMESALPLIDHVWIADTGSTDNTREIIEEFIREHHLKGGVIHHEWKDFAHNRSRVMESLRQFPEIDYALMMDADNYLLFDKNFDARKFKAELTSDLYDVRIRSGECEFTLPILFSNKSPFRYRGVLHEYLESDVASTREVARGFRSIQVQDSARNQNPFKYLDDVEVFEKALETEDDEFLRRRYTFYLAQSYRDADDDPKAVEYYLQRSHLGGWEEEIFVSLKEAGKALLRLGRPLEEAIPCFLGAHEVFPVRAEALHAAAYACREAGRYNQAYLFASHGTKVPEPDCSLFGEPWIYHYGLWDELAIAAYWTGRYKECFDICVRLLKGKDLPLSDRDRVRANAGFAAAQLERPALMKLIP